MSNILVVAAHPDDEILGCGGTIARHVQQGDEVSVLILSEGVTARDVNRSRDLRSDELSALGKMAHAAHKVLGSTNLVLHDFPDNRMDSIDRLDIVKIVEEHIAKYQPEIVYTHHAGDVNIDHRRTHESVVTSCRAMPHAIVKTILFFEIASSTEWQPPQSASAFAPNWFVDISQTLTKKIQALHCYEPEMRAFPHPRSYKALEHLAHWRGACVGVQAAEAFILGRNIK